LVTVGQAAEITEVFNVGLAIELTLELMVGVTEAFMAWLTVELKEEFEIGIVLVVLMTGLEEELTEDFKEVVTVGLPPELVAEFTVGITVGMIVGLTTVVVLIMELTEFTVELGLTVELADDAIGLVVVVVVEAIGLGAATVGRPVTGSIVATTIIGALYVGLGVVLTGRL